MNVNDVKIGFIGFGNMASAMADGWIASGGVEPGNMCACAGRYEALVPRCEARGMRALESPREVVEASDVVVVAVKPYMIEGVLGPIADALAGRAVLSVAAGWDCAAYEGVVLSVAAGWDCAAYEGVVPGAHHLSTIPNMRAWCPGPITCPRSPTRPWPSTRA